MEHRQPRGPLRGAVGSLYQRPSTRRAPRHRMCFTVILQRPTSLPGGPTALHCRAEAEAVGPASDATAELETVAVSTAIAPSARR